METGQINLALLLVGIIAISAIGTYLFCHRRLRDMGSELQRQVASNLETYRSHATELKELAQEHREAFVKHASEAQQKAHDEYERGRRQGELDTDQKAKAFSVVVRPYVCQTKDGTIFKTYSLEIGYQYQLVVNGIPCFDLQKLTDTMIDIDQIIEMEISGPGKVTSGGGVMGGDRYLEEY